MVTQQVESLVTRKYFDLNMTQIGRCFEQVDGRLDRFEDRLAGMQKSLSRHNALLSIITLAVVIQLLQSVVIG